MNILTKYALKPMNIKADEFVRLSSFATFQGDDLEDFFPKRPEPTVDPQNVGHIWISGLLSRGLSNFEKMLGATDYEDIEDEIEDLIEMQPKCILMHISSGGGSACGNVETAKSIQAKCGKTPLHAWVDGMAASAAYCLAASAQKIGCEVSAQVGSIGTIIPYVDQSGAWEMMGLEYQPITNKEAIYKGAGMGCSLTDAQREQLQSIVQSSFELFKGHVLDNRSLSDEIMMGQTVLGMQAKESNLVDFCGTYSEFYSLISK